jgi:valyl-tRNA synthetase
LSLPERWILSRLQTAIDEVRASIDAYRFNEAAMTLYRFIWGEFCDWFVELSKRSLYGEDAAAKRSTQAVLLHVQEQILRLLHPFMPFVTEEIWQALPIARATASIMVAPYPMADAALRDADAEQAVNRLVDIVRAVRNIRSELGIAPTTQVSVRIASRADADGVGDYEPYVKALAKVSRVELLAGSERPSGEPSAVVDGVGEVFVPLRGAVDPAEVRKRLENDLKKVTKELDGVAGKLARPDFVAKAPEEVVGKERMRAAALAERVGTLTRHLETLRQNS